MELITVVAVPIFPPLQRSSPVLVGDEGSCQLDVMGGLRLELAHCGLTLLDHVEKHLRQLRILVQVHQVGQTVVHFKRHSCFLMTEFDSFVLRLL